MTAWRLLESGPASAAFNMALDEAIAEQVRKGLSPPVLRLYEWDSAAVTIGAFQKISRLNTSYCDGLSIPVVRRITGGRAILHEDDLTYSFSSRHEGPFSGRLPDVYSSIGSAFDLCFARAGLDCDLTLAPDVTRPSGNPQCFESVSTGELTHLGMKLIGSAQKRWQDGFMQQGTIPLTIDRVRTKEIFLLQEHADINPHHCGLKELLPELDVKAFRNLLMAAFEETFGVRLISSVPTSQELRLAETLACRKYLDPAWTLEGKIDNRCDNTA